MRVYSLTAEQLAEETRLSRDGELAETGRGLAGVLDRLRDVAPERFDDLNAELPKWIPEFDRVLFETPSDCNRSFLLRTRDGAHAIPARSLSHGSLFAVAILALAHAPFTSPIIAIEEPERGIHPRLLRDVFDVLYRLTHPQDIGVPRDPKQVIVTTHSPQLLDLFRDRPEAVVVAEKRGADAAFSRLSDREDLARILDGLPLGDAWNLGVLGGVPTDK
jgi:predicted ATPase